MTARQLTLLQWGLVLLFAIYSGFFIWRSSYIAIDGLRYFGSFDDAMISMRYAWNLAHGNGLVWNAGEPIEGITNFLWALCLSVINLIFDLRLSVLTASVFAGFLTVANAFVLQRIFLNIADDISEDIPKRGLSVLVFLFPLIHFPTLYYAYMIMETPLVTLLIWSAILVALNTTGKQQVVWGLPLLGGLAYMTRPEALAPIAVIYLYRLITIERPYSLFIAPFRNLRNHFRTVSVELMILGGLVLALTLFRFFYYGSIVPNTYTLKVAGVPFDFRIGNGFIFIIGAIREFGWALLFATIGLVFFRNYKLMMLWELVILMMAYQVYTGGDAFPFLRILVPFQPLILVIIAATWSVGIHRLLTSRQSIATIATVTVMIAILGLQIWIPTGSYAPYPYQAIIMLLILLVGVGISLFGAGLKQSFEQRAPLVMSLILLFCGCVLYGFFIRYWGLMSLEQEPPLLVGNRINTNIAIALDEVTTDEATVGLTAAGTIGYYMPEYYLYDFLGKSDEYIANLDPYLTGPLAWFPGHNKYDFEYSVLQLRPTFAAELAWNNADVRDQATTYETFWYRGARLILDTESPYILWDVLNSDPNLGDVGDYYP